jgi:hypothetical protein
MIIHSISNLAIAPGVPYHFLDEKTLNGFPKRAGAAPRKMRPPRMASGSAHPFAQRIRAHDAGTPKRAGATWSCYGTKLSAEQKSELMEYLKTL